MSSSAVDIPAVLICFPRVQHKEVWLAQGVVSVSVGSHWCVSMSVSSVLPADESCGHEGLITSPIVGNLAVIMPREIHASRLRNSLSELSVMYVICLVSRGSPYGDLPENRRMVAPRTLTPLPLAACISIDTGIKSSAVMPKRGRSLIPPRQLWHPVSVIDGRMLDLVLDFRGNPRSAKSSSTGVIGCWSVRSRYRGTGMPPLCCLYCPLSQLTCHDIRTRSGGVCGSVCTHVRMLDIQLLGPVAAHACHDIFNHNNGNVHGELNSGGWSRQLGGRVVANCSP